MKMQKEFTKLFVSDLKGAVLQWDCYPFAYNVHLIHIHVCGVDVTSSNNIIFCNKNPICDIYVACNYVAYNEVALNNRENPNQTALSHS